MTIAQRSMRWTMNAKKKPRFFERAGLLACRLTAFDRSFFYLSQAVSQDVPQVEHVEQLEQEEQDAP